MSLNLPGVAELDIPFSTGPGLPLTGIDLNLPSVILPPIVSLSGFNLISIGGLGPHLAAVSLGLALDLDAAVTVATARVTKASAEFRSDSTGTIVFTDIPGGGVRAAGLLTGVFVEHEDYALVIRDNSGAEVFFVAGGTVINGVLDSGGNVFSSGGSLAFSGSVAALVGKTFEVALAETGDILASARIKSGSSAAFA